MKDNERFDGYRFAFYYEHDDVLMRDELGEFPPLVMSEAQAEVLGRILREHHELKLKENKDFAMLINLLNILREYNDLDNEILIACINNLKELKS